MQTAEQIEFKSCSLLLAAAACVKLLEPEEAID